MSILSTANSGKFSSDKVVSEYAEQIWKIKPCKRPVWCKNMSQNSLFDDVLLFVWKMSNNTNNNILLLHCIYLLDHDIIILYHLLNHDLIIFDKDIIGFFVKDFPKLSSMSNPKIKQCHRVSVQCHFITYPTWSAPRIFMTICEICARNCLVSYVHWRYEDQW